MTDNKPMTYNEFREIFESLNLRRKDAVAITGKTVNTFDKWAQEDIVKDPAAIALFRLAIILQDGPHYFTQRDVVDLLFKASGATNPYSTELSEDEFRTQTIKRLKAIMSQLEV